MSTHNSKNLFTLAGSDCGEDQHGQPDNQRQKPAKEFGAAHFALEVHTFLYAGRGRFLSTICGGFCNGTGFRRANLTFFRF